MEYIPIHENKSQFIQENQISHAYFSLTFKTMLNWNEQTVKKVFLQYTQYSNTIAFYILLIKYIVQVIKFFMNFYERKILCLYMCTIELTN